MSDSRRTSVTRAQPNSNLGPELNQGLEDRDRRLIKPPIMPDPDGANNDCVEENLMDSMGLLDVRDHVVNKCLCMNMSVCAYRFWSVKCVIVWN